MIDPKTDLLPVNQWNLERWNRQSLQRVLEHGTTEQIDYILDWSYSGCSAACSEDLYELAGRNYPYESNQ